jgi:hypothetical protein
MSVVLGRVNTIWAIYIRTFQSRSQTCGRSASEFIRHVNVQFLSRKWLNMNPAAIVLSCRHKNKLAQITISYSSIIINIYSVLTKGWPSQQLLFTAKNRKYLNFIFQASATASLCQVPPAARIASVDLRNATNIPWDKLRVCGWTQLVSQQEVTTTVP